ncbi:hypothetical protein SD427_18700 (plasmid) [Chryseobacterium sp. JJR-5R]|uniref:hypothetical protein n=1 Tax=Chryseobacterium sp. JJR-5R TaxID=3093923 RepID=UPI002A7515EC|nr:hypothetical protein [Chryseobacterium sp. JJR-5R]WPO84629.1 hypothetical protein SD427_18700 [Chryseobacterium sp. JJR-5R]
MSKKPLILQLDHIVHENPRKARNKALKLLEQLKAENRKSVVLPKGYSPAFETLKDRCRKKKQS